MKHWGLFSCRARFYGLSRRSTGTNVLHYARNERNCGRLPGNPGTHRHFIELRLGHRKHAGVVLRTEGHCRRQGIPRRGSYAQLRRESAPNVRNAVVRPDIHSRLRHPSGRARPLRRCNGTPSRRTGFPTSPTNRRTAAARGSIGSRHSNWPFPHRGGRRFSPGNLIDRHAPGRKLTDYADKYTFNPIILAASTYGIKELAKPSLEATNAWVKELVAKSPHQSSGFFCQSPIRYTSYRQLHLLGLGNAGA